MQHQAKTDWSAQPEHPQNRRETAAKVQKAGQSRQHNPVSYSSPWVTVSAKTSYARGPKPPCILYSPQTVGQYALQ